MALGRDDNTIFPNRINLFNMKNISFRQKKQDWFTQQWVILRGKQLDSDDNSWLLGPFGRVGDTGEDFIYQLAQKEQLVLLRNCTHAGLLPSLHVLELSKEDQAKIDPRIVEFYEQTSEYNLRMSTRWNPIFKCCGYLVNLLFSNRLKQLYIPTKNELRNEPITSEIIQLITPQTKEIHYTFWLRTLPSQETIIFSGVYSTCLLPIGKKAVKAVFPLPNGNATVFLKPQVGTQGELILDSSGKNWGEAGFYFLLQDTKEKYWARFIPSFKDKLIVQAHSNGLTANQQLKLWGIAVLSINYQISAKKQSDL